MAGLKCNIIQKQLEHVLGFLEPLLPFANSHMVDYFSKSVYENDLPCELQTEISKIGCKEALNIILNNETNVNAPNLNEYINKAKSLHLYNIQNICLSKSVLHEKLSEWGCNDVTSLKLEIFITPKKSHEVEVLSKIAAAINLRSKTTHVIDIGDGKGYLSSMLALHNKIPVLGIDASLINTDGAVKRSRMLAKVWKGLTKNSKTSIPTQNVQMQVTDNLYKQVTQFVTENTDFGQLISDVFFENSKQLGLVGLHTCGNLGSTSVKIFNNNEQIRTICNVSCCYHLLTEEFEETLPNFNSEVSSTGFPMSAFLRHNRFQLGRNARMLSAHSIDRILHKKELPNKIIFYRSILEVLLIKYNVSVQQRQVGRLRKGSKEFTDYANKALRNLNTGISVTNEELIDLYDRYENYEDQINVFYLLRCMLAPVIESLILLDRLLFLHENQHESAFLVHLFDPVISPRCYGLIAFKK